MLVTMNRTKCILAVLALLIAGSAAVQADLWQAPVSFGFSISVPYTWPIAWDASFSYLSTEALLSENVTAWFDLGTYPASFPDLYEAGASLLVKGWVGPTAVYAGGGVSMQYRRVGTAWALKPFLALRAGYQIWVLDALALSLQFRSLDAFPLSWTLVPEVSLGLQIGVGRARPERPRFDGDYLWFLVGLAAAALIAFLPRK